MAALMHTDSCADTNTCTKSKMHVNLNVKYEMCHIFFLTLPTKSCENYDKNQQISCELIPHSNNYCVNYIINSFSEMNNRRKK